MSAYYDLYQTPDPLGKEGKQLLHARILPRGTITASKFLEIVHNATGFSRAMLNSALQAITDELQRWLKNDWIVVVGELDLFSVSLKCFHYVQDPKDIRFEKYDCITRADYEALPGKTKQQAVTDLNKFLEGGIIRKYGSGRTVVYLKGGEG